MFLNKLDHVPYAARYGYPVPFAQKASFGLSKGRTICSAFRRLNFTEFSYYEITRGFKASAATTQLAKFEQFCRSHNALPFTHQAAMIAADIWAHLKRQGLLIGEVDILIASIALCEQSTVAAHNTAHFNRVKNLQIVDWTI